jgi:predicted O-methyltransferase YrrM
MSMARGFQAAQMLMVAVDLGVFDHLEESRSAGAVASLIKADDRATGIFLDGLAALGLLVKKVDHYHNSEAASRFLVQGKEDYRGAILKHMHHTMRSWANLEQTILMGHPPDRDPERWLDAHQERSEEEVRDFIWGMHALARDLAPQVAAQLDLGGVRCLLDLGGGPATYAIIFAQVQPQLTATVFDLPGPIKIARENIARHGLEERISTLAGNFLKDDIGRGYDFVWISQILHSHDEDQCRLIINKGAQALNPGGQMAIQDFYLEDNGYAPPAAAMFGVHMLAVTPRGRAYKHREVAQWMEEAGLTLPEFRRTSTDAAMLVARKKSAEC